MPLVLTQEILGFDLRGRKLQGRQVQFIDYEDDFNWRIRLGGNSIECLKGDNVSRLTVVPQCKVTLPESGDWIS